jgi:PAS domain S-box-containing protein
MSEPDEAAATTALQRQIADLRQTLDSIRAGGVDAVISGLPGHEQVYSLTSADRPYRLLVEEMNEGALMVSGRGVVLYANARMIELTGRPGRLVGSAAADLVAPADRAALVLLLDQAPGEHGRHEMTLLAPRGGIPVLAAASCLDLEGTRVHCLILSDLRQQKEVEARLRAGERRLEQFLDAVPVGLRITDAQADTQYLNTEARRQLSHVGLADVAVGEVKAAYVGSATDEPAAAVDLPLARALRGETSHTDDLDLRGPDGSRLPVELWGTSILDDSGAVEFGIVASADVTRRREIQHTIVEQATLLELAHDAVIVWDDASGIRYWNRGAELTYGFSRETALGRLPSELLHTELPEPWDRVRSALDTVGQWEGELRQVDAAGSAITVAARLAPHPGPDRAGVGIVEVNRDITARKAAEVALAERAGAVIRANQELHRSNQDLEQFAYAASHDLAEPLRAISLPITLLSRRYAGQLDEDADAYISFIVDGCARMQQMIDSLLVYSRVGRLESRTETVDLSRVLEGVLEQLRPTIEERRAVVTSDPLPVVVAVPVQMTQVLQNLVSNALKFTAPDVVPRAHVGCERRGASWWVTVDDNGIGIDPAHRERVFGMFKRLHSREEYPGTGIGLALVKKIVERHGGEVGVEDGPAGTGCRFWFTLPADASTSPS